jgi:hypothetical protein
MNYKVCFQRLLKENSFLFYLAITMNQTNNENIQRSDNEDELQQNLAILTIQCVQLDEANRAWQQFQQAQLDNFRNKLQNKLSIDQNLSFDEIAQLIINYLNQLVNERDHLIQNLHTTEKMTTRKILLFRYNIH